MYYSKEQINRASQMDLEQFLRNKGETLIKSGREYRWARYDSVTICKNQWYRHSRNVGGHPIDFVMTFYGMDFSSAMEMILGEQGELESSIIKPPSAEFHPPERNVNNDIALRYLTEERKLERQYVQYFIDCGILYEDTQHDVIFLGLDENNIPRYAHRRSADGTVKKDVRGSDKAYNFCYSGIGKTLYVFEAAIDLLSFIQLFPSGWQENSYLALGGVGSKAMEQFLSAHDNIEEVYLCLDSDDAGDEACLRLAKQAPDSIRILRLKPALKDWNELIQKMESMEGLSILESFEINKDSGVMVKMIRMSDITEKKVEFLWKPYLPFGKLTIIQGNPGEGKTYLAMQIVAACTANKLLPNMEPVVPFNVIYQTAEDGLADTIKPRLIEAGADLSRVFVIDDREGEQLTLTDERIRNAIIQNKARLLIIDPIQAYVGPKVDMNRANEVRPIIRALGMVAEETGCCIILIGHLNKAVGMQSTYRGLGSIDFTAGVRSILFVGRSQEDPNLRIMAHEKSSLAPPGCSLAFMLGDDDGWRWIGVYEATADELCSGLMQKQPTKSSQAIDLIYELLANGEKITSAELDSAAISRGISTRTLRNAKKEMGSVLKSAITENHQKLYWMEKNLPLNGNAHLTGKVGIGS